MNTSFIRLGILLLFLGSHSLSAQENDLPLKKYAESQKAFISVEVASLTGDESLLLNQSFNGFDAYESTLSTRFSLNYRLFTGLSLGVGSGIDHYQINTALPIYIALSGNLSKKKFSPFYQFNVGHALPWSKDKEEFEYSGGWYWETSIGLQSWISETQAIFFKVGLQQQKMSIEYPFAWTVDGRTIQEHRLERLRLGLGFVF